MSFNPIRENKVLAKISEFGGLFTVVKGIWKDKFARRMWDSFIVVCLNCRVQDHHFVYIKYCMF